MSTTDVGVDRPLDDRAEHREKLPDELMAPPCLGDPSLKLWTPRGMSCPSMERERGYRDK